MENKCFTDEVVRVFLDNSLNKGNTIEIPSLKIEIKGDKCGTQYYICIYVFSCNAYDCNWAICGFQPLILNNSSRFGGGRKGK